jgi:hypothetical protein
MGWPSHQLPSIQRRCGSRDLRHEIAHGKASGRPLGELEMPGQYGAAPVTISRAGAILAAQGVVVVTCGRRAFPDAGE